MYERVVVVATIMYRAEASGRRERKRHELGVMKIMARTEMTKVKRD